MPPPKNKRFHYTYLLEAVNPLGSELYYFGVRSCSRHPAEDGTYMSSSRDIAKSIAFGVAFKKHILAIWPTREDAVAHEVRLHDAFNVGVNPKYFNRAKQTNTKFDTAGTKFTDGRKAKKRSDTTAVWSDDEKRQRIHEAQIASYDRPEVRANRSRSSREAWDNPKIRNKCINNLKNALSTPEARAIKKARMKEQWEKKRTERLDLISAVREFCSLNGIAKPGKGYCFARSHPDFAAFLDSRSNR